MHHLSISAFVALMTLSATAACSAVADGESGSAEDQDQEGNPPRTKWPAPGSDPAGGGGSDPAPSGPQTTDLHYSAKGDPKDPAVVFLHGGPGANSMMFELTVQESIAKLGYYVIAYDQRGSTRSPPGTGAKADYSFARATQDLDDLIGALGVKSPVLLGHSFGGTIALHYLERFKGKTKGAIVVASPMSFPDTYDTTLSECAARYTMWGRMKDAQNAEALRSAMFPNGLTPPYAYTGADIDAVIQCQAGAMLYFPPLPTQGDLAFASAHGQNKDVTAVNPAVGSGFQANDKVGHADYIPLLGAHKNEVLGIYAPSWDVMFSEAQLGRIEANVRSYFTVADAGHFIFMDQPESFTQTVGQALAQMK